MRKWAGLGLGMGLAAVMLTAFACGGSEETSPGSSGGTEAGSETSTTTDSSKPETSSLADAKFDGYIDAPEVSFTFGTCPAFDACGGDEKGSWKVSGGCLSDEILDQAKNTCGPDVSVGNAVIKAKGTVEVDGAIIVRHTQVHLTAKVFVPNSGICGNAIGAGGCATLDGFAGQVGFDKMTCKDAADGGSAAGCDCDVETTQIQNSTSKYTKDGATLTTEGGDTFDYCVEGSKLTYTQTNAQGQDQPLPLFIELSK